MTQFFFHFHCTLHTFPLSHPPTGRTSPSLAQQISTCTSQMTDLVAGASQAFISVHRLILHVQHAQIKSSGCPRACNNISSDSLATCPTSFSSITRAVCPLLAAALPSLRWYAVEGCCMDAAFDAFGAFCPQLSLVQVDAVTVPIRALRDINRSLPNLKTVDLRAPQSCPGNSRLSAYVGACLDLLQTSTSLTSLALGFDETVCLECKPGQWNKVPVNLHSFRSLCAVNSLNNSPLLLGKLKILYMHSYPSLDLLLLLQTAPGLQRLGFTPSTKTTNKFTILCDEEDTMQTIMLLKERIHGGLLFQVPVLDLDGTFESVQAVLSCLPPLPMTQYLGVTFDDAWEGVPSPDCLAHISRVCPNITTFAMWHFKASEDTWTGMQLLGPLTGIASLQHLRIILQTQISSAELAELCLSMAALESVGFCRSWLAGVDDDALKAELNKGGRDIKIEQYPIL